jgi:hypothetical protein
MAFTLAQLLGAAGASKLRKNAVMSVISGETNFGIVLGMLRPVNS